MKSRTSTKNRLNHPRRVVASVVAVLILACSVQAKPDLIVSKIVLTRGGGGILVDRVSITVRNGCVDAANSSHLQITFKENAESDAKQIYYLVSPIRALHGGESQTLTFNVLEKKIVYGRYFIAEVDTYKKIDEVSEENNLRTMFPDGSPSASRCQ